MTEKFKKLILKTLYTIIVFYIILFTVAVVFTMFQPSFFPAMDVSGFYNITNVANSFLSFASVCLAVYSVYQSAESNKQAEQLFQMISNVQSTLDTALNSHITSTVAKQIRRGEGVDSVK